MDSSNLIKTRIPAGRVKKGDVVIIKGRPCKIVSISISKTGKHGHSKVCFSGVDFDLNIVEDVFSSEAEIEMV